jgi:hypothetical protein
MRCTRNCSWTVLCTVKPFFLSLTYPCGSLILLHFHLLISVLEYISVTFVYNFVYFFTFFITYNTDWTVPGSNPGGGVRIVRTRSDRPLRPTQPHIQWVPSLSPPPGGGEAAVGVALTTHPHTAPRIKK